MKTISALFSVTPLTLLFYCSLYSFSPSLLAMSSPPPPPQRTLSIANPGNLTVRACALRMFSTPNCSYSVSSRYNDDSSVVLLATGSHFKSWSGCDGLSWYDTFVYKLNNTHCYVYLNRNRSVRVNYYPPPRLTLRTNGTGSVLCNNSPCQNSYPYNTQITLTARPGNQHLFSGWSGSCSGTSSCRLLMNTNRSVTANFIPQYRLTISKTGNGKGSHRCNNTTCARLYRKGTRITIQTYPDSQSTVTINGESCTGSSCSLLLDRNRSITIKYQLKQYTLTVTPIGNGAGNLNNLCFRSVSGVNSGTCTGIFNHGTQYQLTAYPDSRSVVNWSMPGCTGNSCLVTMNRNMAVTPTFTIKTHTLRVTPTGNGAGNINNLCYRSANGINSGTCTGTFNHGIQYQLTAYPDARSMVSWSKPGCTGNNCLLTMNSDLSVTPTFTLNSHQLLIQKTGAGNGTVTGSGINCGNQCSSSLNAGTSIQLTATPSTGSKMTGWSETQCGTANTCTINVTTARTIRVNFAKQGCAEASFRLDTIGNQTAGKTSSQYQLRENSGKCDELKNRNVPILISATCENPNICAGKRVTINQTTIQTNNRGNMQYSTVNLNFNSQSAAQFALNYPDAGQIRLHFRYDAQGKTLNISSNTFQITPIGLCIQAPQNNATCPAPYQRCSAFKKAGEDFQLTLKAMTWERDNDTDLCSGNQITPNFQVNSIGLDHLLIDPGGGAKGSLSVFSTAIRNGQATLNQRISEVGVFRFTSNPVTYFNQTIPRAQSAVTGRFTADHFNISMNQPELRPGCGTFTYIDQNFDFMINPSITITAKNKQNLTTQNYAGNYWKLKPTLSFSNQNTPSGVNFITSQPSYNTPAISAGQATYTFYTNNLRFSATNPSTPFSSKIEGTFTIKDSDNITLLGASPTTQATNNHAIQYGRIKTLNSFSASAQNHALPVSAQYCIQSANNTCTQWMTSSQDNCTSLNNTLQQTADNPTNVICNNVRNPLRNKTLCPGDLTTTGATNINNGSSALTVKLINANKVKATGSLNVTAQSSQTHIKEQTSGIMTIGITGRKNLIYMGE